MVPVRLTSAKAHSPTRLATSGQASTDPNANTGSFSLYPNPANDHVFITTSGDLKRVTVYNALGQLVTDEITTGKQYELSTASYTIGVYMVRVETAAGVTTRTLTIQR